jgi:hypothetical protein
VEVDKPMADFLHPNDKRKVVNALFKYFRQLSASGIRASDIASGKANDLQLRFLPVLVWLKAD